MGDRPPATTGGYKMDLSDNGGKTELRDNGFTPNDNYGPCSYAFFSLLSNLLLAAMLLFMAATLLFDRISLTNTGPA